MAEKEEPPSGDQPSEKQAKAEAKKPAKKAKQPKQPKQPKQEDGLYLPVLAELTYASSVIFLILVFLAMAAVSWLTGTSALDFVLRTSVAMTVLGSLLLVVSRQVTAGVLRISQAEIEERRREEVSPQLVSTENLEQPKKPVNTEIPKSAEAHEGVEILPNDEA